MRIVIHEWSPTDPHTVVTERTIDVPEVSEQALIDAFERMYPDTAAVAETDLDGVIQVDATEIEYLAWRTQSIMVQTDPRFVPVPDAIVECDRCRRPLSDQKDEIHTDGDAVVCLACKGPKPLDTGTMMPTRVQTDQRFDPNPITILRYAFPDGHGGEEPMFAFTGHLTDDTIRKLVVADHNDSGAFDDEEPYTAQDVYVSDRKWSPDHRITVYVRRTNLITET